MSVLVEDGHTTTYPLNHARILYRNVITAATATGSEVNQPPASALTKTTYERWRPLVSGDSITGTFPEQVINAVALAAHSDLTPTVEIRVGGVWETVQAFPPEGPTLVSDFAADEYELLEYSPDNEAVLFLIKPRLCDAVRITATYSGTTPSLGVLMAGTVLEMHRPFYGGHTPAMLTSDSVLQPNISESGEWLGASLLRQGRPVRISWDNLPAAWVRRYWQPFSDVVLQNPFVVAWNPLRASADAIYCSTSERPAPRNTGTRNLQSVSLSARGYSDGTTPVVQPLAPSSFDEQYTFTRLSEGTYYDFNGVLRTAAVNEPRFTHDPETGESLGLLVEEERTNLLIDSEDLGGASWGLTNASVEANATASPDGQVSADALVENDQSGAHQIVESINLLAGQTYSVSYFAAARERFITGLQITGPGFPTLAGITDLQSGDSDFTVREVASGFYRIWETFTAADAGAYIIRFQIADNAGNVSYLGDGTSGLYIWGAQLEVGAFPTSYMKTEGTSVTREADEVSRVLGAEFNSGEWAVYSEGVITVGDLNFGSVVAALTDGTTANRVAAFYAGEGASGNGVGGVFRILSVVSGATSLSETADTGLRQGDFYKAALARNGDNYDLYLNGVKVLSQTRTIDNTLFSTFRVSDAGGITLGGIYKEARVYAKTKTPAELKALTSPET